MGLYRSLDNEKIISLARNLHSRIKERFPESGLGSVCEELLHISEENKKRIKWLSQPIIGLRIIAYCLTTLIIAGIATTLASMHLNTAEFSFIDSVQTLEAGINDIVLIGAAVYFLLTSESTFKRTRALKFVHELRSIAHIIDMHQLTKDPERLLSRANLTKSSPNLSMSVNELCRYLDYCSEMLSLTGKIAAVYVQNFNDPLTLASVNEVESLTTGLSRKIWQKIIIVHSLDESVLIKTAPQTALLHDQ